MMSARNTLKVSVRGALALVTCLLTAPACGDAGAESEAPSEDLLPLAEGNRWTYRVTDGDEVTEKTVTVGAEQAVGGGGPHAKQRAFLTTIERPGETTRSWQASVDGKVVRYREQVVDPDDGDVEREESWEPYRLHVDGTPEHIEEGASWLEKFDETVFKADEEKPAETIRERWTVLAASQSVTVPAGTFDAVVLQKAGGTKLKTYWYVPGVGKVKETGGQNEELVDYELAE